MRSRRMISIAALLAVGVGCEGASSDPGLNAFLRATGAQYAPGELLTAMGVPGPTVDLVSTNSTTVRPGLQNRGVTGSAKGTASAILVGLTGDIAHWILPLGIEDSEEPGDFTFQTTLSFSPDLPLGPRPLIFRAITPDGVVGPAHTLALKVQAPVPMGSLVVSLDWDTDSDLDLHLTVPNPADATMPVVVWAKNPLALPSGHSYTMDQVMAAGQLDGDSNSQCVIDGRRQEDVIFPVAPAPAPPSGTYEVRVDASSLCGQGVARWHAVAVVNGDTDHPLGEAFGQMTDLDAAGAHMASSGTLAFTFSIP